MKIIVLTSSLGAGGAERVATTLCNFWGARGDKVSLIATFSGGGLPFYPMANEVELIYLADVVARTGQSIASHPRRLLALRGLIDERKPDVVVSFLPNVNVAAILATAALKVPLIICERSDPSMQPYTPFWRIACRLSYRFADMLTVQTDAVARKARTIFPGVKRIRSVPNPMPASVVKYVKKKTGDRKILLSIGRLSKEKQVERIIDAFGDLAADFKDWDLHIYGDGPLRAALEAKIEQPGLQGRALLKGSTGQPWEVMAGADAFIMASLYEGFPNALMEAMGTGLPCIAFDCPSGPREISDDGENATLVPLNDQESLTASLKLVMSDEPFRILLGQKARASVMSRFGLTSVVAIWDELFREVGAIR